MNFLKRVHDTENPDPDIVGGGVGKRSCVRLRGSKAEVRTAAFTLVELMIVVTIIMTILGTWGYRQLANAPMRELNSGLKELEGALWDAKFMAINEGLRHMVVFRDGTDATDPISYTIRIDGASDGVYQNDTLDPPPPAKNGAWLRWHVVKKGVYFNSGAPPAPISFNDRGAAVIGGEVDLATILGDGSSAREIAKCLEAEGPRLRVAGHYRDSTDICDPDV